MTLLLRKLLRILAVLTIRKFQPGIIAVTGTVGKTSTKEAIYAILRSVRQVRASSANFNNELGLPLTILGDWNKIGQPIFFWPKVIISSCWQLLFGPAADGYPELLILEYAADRPGDIKYLLSIARPQIAVITAIGEIPVHVEFYASPEHVAREKARLVEVLPITGCAILNYDDELVYQMRERTRAHIITYGFGQGANVRISGLENRSEEIPVGHEQIWKPMGITFKLESGDNFIPIRLDGAFGKAQAYAMAAATAVGTIYGMNLITIAQASQYYQPPQHRFKVIPGIKGTFILDDSYNASPLSMAGALETVKSLKAKRKVGILGDMLELGEYTITAHEEAGRLAARVFDLLITVGSRSQLIAAAARKAGLDKKLIFSYDTASEAGVAAQTLIEKGDLILVKASRGIGLERVVEEIKYRTAVIV